MQDSCGDYSGGTVTDPRGPRLGSSRELRGGSRHDDALLGFVSHRLRTQLSHALSRYRVPRGQERTLNGVHHIEETLRLRQEMDRIQREIAGSCRIPQSSVHNVLTRPKGERGGAAM